MKTLLACLLLLLPAAGAASSDRAVWVWEKESYAMLESRATARDAAAFLKSRGINTVYLYADAFQGRSLLLKKPRLYRRLILYFRSEGISTYALLGSYYLRTHEYVRPARHAEAVAMLDRVLAYNAAVKAEERFDGVNFDIEPHMLKEWNADTRKSLLGDFFDMGRKLMDQKKARKAELPIGPAVPFWLDGIPMEWEGKEKTAGEHAAGLFDYLALMDYRNKAEGRDGIISHAETELEYSSKLGRKVIIGVDMGKDGLKKLSFHTLKVADMERELGLAKEAFLRHPSFGGFVIHHYRTYRNWLESQEKKD